MIDSNKILDLDELVALVGAATSIPVVRSLGDSRFAVDVPNPRMPHDYVTVFVEQQAPRRWFFSDAGAGTRAVGRSIGQASRHASCAGFWFELDGEELVASVVCDATALPAYLFRFAAEVAVAPDLARLVECATYRPKREPSVPVRMAAGMVDILYREIPGLERTGAVRLRERVSFGPRPVTPGLAVYQPELFRAGREVPVIVCEFIDMTADARSKNPAFDAASSTFTALQTIQRRFLIARGDESTVEELAGVFDRINVTTLGEDNFVPLVESVRELDLV